jgi:hypothetical protein
MGMTKVTNKAKAQHSKVGNFAIDCEININSERAMYYCEKKLRQWKSVRRRLEMKWMKILKICHMMLKGIEKFNFLSLIVSI